MDLRVPPFEIKLGAVVVPTVGSRMSRGLSNKILPALPLDTA
jgi:hypothetical protein